MTKPAAFRATYSDFKLVRTRKVVQLVFEVPIEGADAALDVLGGMPNPAAEVWCGIALLQEPGTRLLEREAVDALSGPRSSASRPKQSWHDMSPAQQAGVLCNDPAFSQFLRETERDAWRISNGDAASIIRNLCNVTSRKDILPDTPAAKAWRSVVADFRVWERALV